jgi:hypothetical protein
MKNKTTRGLGNKNLLSFPKHDSLKYWRLVKVTPVKSLPFNIKLGCIFNLNGEFDKKS